VKKNLRIGVIGAGANTRSKHLPGFQAIPGVEVAVVCNQSRESGERVAKEFGIPKVAAHWQEVVEAKDLDAVCVGTWPNLHAKVSVAALRAGKHVLCEARMARNLAEAELMLAESGLRPKLVAQIVPSPMSLPFDAAVIAILKSGGLGALREVVLTCTHAGWASAAAPPSWRQDFTLSGKNTLYLGIYYEIALRWLARDVSSVVAEAAIFTKERKDAEGTPQAVTIPDSLSVLARYEDGCRLVGHFSGVETTAPRSEIRLNGSKAGLRLDLAREELWRTEAGGAEQLVDVPEAQRGRWRVEADFVDSIREGKPVTLTDFATGVRYMRFTDAVWESWNNEMGRVGM
jgi:predicted dehydrogenase